MAAAARLEPAEDLELVAVDVTPGFYRVPYIVSYLVHAPGAPLIVVDPGPSATGCSRVLDWVERLGADRVVVYITHVHIDHAGAVGCLARSLGGRLLRVYAHPRAVPHLENPSRLWRASRSFLGWIAEGYGEPLPVPPRLLEATADGARHSLGPVVIHVLHTPGHASHHQSIVLETGSVRVLFPGDSAGMAHPAVDAVAPTTPPPFRYNMYRESLLRQARAEPGLVAYTHTGLGEPSLLHRHLRQAETWWRAALELAEAAPDPPPERLLEKAAERDEDTRRFLDYASANSPALYEALRHSAMGFLLHAAETRRPRAT